MSVSVRFNVSGATIEQMEYEVREKLQLFAPDREAVIERLDCEPFLTDGHGTVRQWKGEVTARVNLWGDA